MSYNPMSARESEYNLRDSFKDAHGQAHFPNVKLSSGQMDVVRLGKLGGYYPLMGEKKQRKGKAGPKE